MSFLAPAFLYAAIGAAGIVVALHFIVMRQPPMEVMPTARFIPMRPAVARTVARRPEDLLLLLLRALAILLVGAAFARPVWHPRRVAVVHIVLADRSRAVGDAREVADSVRGVRVGAGDVLVVFDSTVHVTDSVAAIRRGAQRGSISAALVSGLRAAVRERDRADSIEIVLVSPVVAEEVDAAMDSIRALWPGAVRLVRVAARGDSGASVRATVDWPAVRTGVRATIDTVNAVVAGNVVVVAPFERRTRVDTAGARVIARWVDGEPAAVERVPCARDVAVPVPTEGDLVLRPEWRRFEAMMRAPCGALVQRAVAWASDTMRPRRVAARALSQASIVPSAIATWLLAAGALAMLIEPLARRRRA